MVRIVSENNRQPTDGELIEHIAGGDRGAFEELYRRYVRAVLGLALRRIGDRGRAEDATQDTFASLWRSAGRFDPTRGKATSWLFTVARNAIIAAAAASPTSIPPSCLGPSGIVASDAW